MTPDKLFALIREQRRLAEARYKREPVAPIESYPFYILTPEQEAKRVEAEVCGTLVKSTKQMDEVYAKLVKLAGPILPSNRKLLLRMPWLPPRRCRAMKEYLGGSVREYNQQIRHAEATALRQLVDEAKMLMRRNGRRPRGGIHAAALDEVAKQQGLSSGVALKKRLQRYR
jgi:hypothetical protein